MLRAERSLVRWESTKCISHRGIIEFTDLREKAGRAQSGWGAARSSETIVEKWKIILDFAESYSVATLKEEDQVIATYDTKENPHLFGPQEQAAKWGVTTFFKKANLKIQKDNHAEKKDVISLEYVINEYLHDFVPRSGLSSLQPRLQPLYDMMEIMFDDAETADVCFIIRHSTVSNDQPRRIYALTKVLMRRCDYFRTLFESHFIENKDGQIDVKAFNEHRWEVGSDSDYDCEEIADIEERETEDLETEMDTVKAEFEQHKTKRLSTKEVYIVDSSYRTYRALLFYLYTGCIAFAPLRSTYKTAKKKALQADVHCKFPSRAIYNDESATVISPDNEKSQIKWVSAKSMYKLCDKLGISDLKTAAAEFIHNSLTPETVLCELCSTFSSLFPEILQDQDAYLETHLSEVCKTESFARYMKRMFAKDSGAHAKIMYKHVMTAIQASSGRGQRRVVSYYDYD